MTVILLCSQTLAFLYELLDFEKDLVILERSQREVDTDDLGGPDIFVRLSFIDHRFSLDDSFYV